MQHIKGFNFLRGVSILLVLFNHLGSDEYFQSSAFLKERCWKLFSGETGVQLFFVLSGYLITTILFKELTKYGAISVKRFYLRRFLRLLPPLILFYAVVAGLGLSGQITINFIGFAVSALYLYNFVPNKLYNPELGHTWSLAVEEQFYLLWPWVLLYIRSMKRLLLFCAVIIGLCILVVYLYPLVKHETPEKTYYLTHSFKTNRWLFPAVLPVLLGCLTSLFQEKLAQHGILKRSLCFALVLFLSPLYVPQVVLPITFAFQGLAFALLIWYMLGKQQSTFINSIEQFPISYIGKISYGIYVYQGLFLRTGPGDGLWIQQFPQNIVLTLSIAVLSYHLLERPILRLRDRVL